MRLDLAPSARSAALTVRNEAESPRSFSIRAMAWRQDESGEDIYEEAPDLIYFPRLLTLEPGQDAAIRLGLRQPLAPGQSERSYRLFVEEMPPVSTAAQGPSTGALLRVQVRFGVPVFAVSQPPVRRLTVEGLAADQSGVQWLLRNEGNQHERFEHVRVIGRDRQGAEVFSEAVPARYFLAGAQRRFEVPFPARACAKLAHVQLIIKTDQSELERQLDVDPAACQ